MSQNNENEKPLTTGGTCDQIGGFSLGGVFNWISRLMIASLFIITGILAAMNFREFVGTVQKIGLPQPLIFAVLGILTKIVGGLLFTGFMPIPFGTTIGKLSLLTFTALATYFVHNPLKDRSQLENMLKNIAIMGGLLAA